MRHYSKSLWWSNKTKIVDAQSVFWVWLVLLDLFFIFGVQKASYHLLLETYMHILYMHKICDSAWKENNLSAEKQLLCSAEFDWEDGLCYHHRCVSALPLLYCLHRYGTANLLFHQVFILSFKFQTFSLRFTRQKYF